MADGALETAIKQLGEAAKKIAALRLELSLRDATLDMAVARLGGTVEGRPTARHNFLQRIDELVSLSKPRFEKTYCSHCGREFGPGDHGYSHCEDHKGAKGTQ